ncbi:MAG: tyrosine-type recombinase/integrase [Elusimicrobiota bacterium]
MGIKLIDIEKKKYRIAFWFKKKHYTKVVAGNKKLAEAVERQMIAALEEGRYFPQRQFKDRTFEEVADVFIRDCPTFKKSAHKVAIYARKMKLFFKGKMIKDIQSSDVVRLREYLDQDMTPVSTNHYHRALRRLFNWAIQEKLHRGDNPASGKCVPLENERPYWRKVFLNEHQLGRLLDDCEDRLRPIVYCAVLTGMRIGELRRMKKIDVDLDSCVIQIPESKNGESGWIPIPEKLYEVLSPIVAGLENNTDLVLDFKNFERMWKRARQKSNLQLHFHDLRRTYGSHLMMKTGNHGTVQTLLRHKSPAMTARYAHLAPNFLRQSVLTLDGLFPSSKDKVSITAQLPSAPPVVEKTG